MLDSNSTIPGAERALSEAYEMLRIGNFIASAAVGEDMCSEAVGEDMRTGASSLVEILDGRPASLPVRENLWRGEAEYGSSRGTMFNLAN
jgi:hypothetical protein